MEKQTIEKNLLTLFVLFSFCVSSVLSQAGKCDSFVNKKTGARYPWCTGGHCGAMYASTGVPFGQQLCEDSGVWEVNGYCAASAESKGPDPPVGSPCLCNCYCFAHGTPITIDLATNKTVAVETIKPGDKVLALSIESGTKKWKPTEVFSSSGSPAKSRALAIRIEHQRGVIISNPEQLFLVDVNGKEKLIRAGRLQNGHKLVTADWSTSEITSLVAGEHQLGLWNIIAGDPNKVTDIYSHLIIAGGLVAGDFYDQQTLKSDDLDLPEIGTLEHKSKNRLPKSISPRTKSDLHFKSFALNSFAKRTPSEARSFLPEFLETGPHLHYQVSSIFNATAYNSAKLVNSLFSGMKEDFEFDLIWDSDVVNAYSWRDATSGKQRVLVHGGIARHRSIGWQGLAIIYARQIGQFDVISNFTYNHEFPGLGCEYAADYSAAMKLRIITSFDGPTATFEDFWQDGISQLESFFNSMPSLGTLEKQQCGHPKGGVDTKCRVETFQAGYFGYPFPSCWWNNHNNQEEEHDGFRDEL